ncbi:hypothetical protein E8E11_005005, partial [Didymella keratinophila]
ESAKKIAPKSSLETSLAYILLWTALESLLKFAGSDAERIGCVFNWFAVLAAMMQFIVPYLSAWPFDLLTRRIIVSNEQGDVNNIRRWISEHTVGSGRNYVNIQIGRTEFREGSANLVHEVKRHSAARPTFYFFGRWPLHVERIDKELDDNRSRMCGPFHPSGTSFGDTVRISTVIGGRKVLEKFVQSVLRAKRAKTKTNTVFDVEGVTGFGPSRLECRRRAVPSRSMETIDLAQGMKDEMIQDFETFVDANRADWYMEQGIPYYRGYLFYGPPETGKSSTAFALVCLRDKCLYTLSLKEVHSQTELRQLFGAPCKGDVLLLADVDTAGIRREEMQVQAPESMKLGEDSSDDKPPRHRRRRTGITLAGPLDAIDGAREGGVLLIMTTNRLEVLDAALVRAGRIDKENLFGKTSKDIVGRIFKQMYKDQTGEADFNDLANSFESAIPENDFTAAQVQGFLIAHSTSRATVEHIAAWIEAERIKKDQDLRPCGSEDRGQEGGQRRADKDEGHSRGHPQSYIVSLVRN